jgi:hypothetical protein
MPSVPRTSSWPMKPQGINEGGIDTSFGGGGIGGQNRPVSNAPSPTVLSPTQAGMMRMANEDAPSAVIQVSQPNVGMPYAPQRGGSGSPSMMQVAQQYAAAFQQQQQQVQHQYEQEQHQQQQYEYQEHQQPMQGAETAEAVAGWGQQETEMAQMYDNTGYDAEQYNEQYNEGYGEQYNDQQQYYDNQQYNTQQQYGGEAEMPVYTDNDAAAAADDGGGHDDQNRIDFAANSRKLPPPAVSYESPIKARFARGAAHPSARAGALAGVFNKAAAMTGGLPPPPQHQGPLQMPPAPEVFDDGYNNPRTNHMMMQGFPSGGFAGSSVASAPAGEEGDGEVEQQQQQETAPVPVPAAPLPSVPPPPMMGALPPGGGFPTFGSKPMLARNDSNQSQPGSARGNAPPQFGGGALLSSAGSGNFMGGPGGGMNNNMMNSRGSMDGLSGQQQQQQTGLFKPSNMMVMQPGSPRGGAGAGGSGDVGRSNSGQQQQQKQTNANQKPRKQIRRGIFSVFFMITLVLTLSAAVSVGTTIVAVTFAANMAHAGITGIGSIAHGASLSSAIAAMHPAAMGVAKHVDEVSQAQWRATENKLKCDESKPFCRGARQVLHSARLSGFLAKDAALFTAAHAPKVIQQTGVPAVHFTKQQSALLFEQLKGMKTPEGREVVVSAVHQSAGEVKKLGQDLFVWGQCVYQHLSQSGIHSFNHLVEPSAGCWEETMGHYYLPAGTGEESGVKDAADAVEKVEEKEVETEAVVAGEAVKQEDEGELLVEKEPVEKEEDTVTPETTTIVEEKKEEEETKVDVEVEPTPAPAAPSPMLLEEEEEEEKEQVVEDVEVDVVDQGLNATVAETPEPTPVEVEKVPEVQGDAPATTNTTTSTTTTTTSAVSTPEVEEKEEKEEAPTKDEEAIEVEEEDEVVEEEEEQLVEEVPAAAPPPAAVRDAEVAEEKVKIEEEVATPQAPEVAVETPTTTTKPSTGLPERYASEEEYMMGNNLATEEEDKGGAAGGDGDGDGSNIVKDATNTNQGPPGASIIKKSTTKSSPSKPLWPILVAKLREIQISMSRGVDGVVVVLLKAHQASILVALGAAGGISGLVFAINALAARKAATLAAAGGAQPLTPRRQAADEGQEGPSTVFKSARSKRKTQAVVTTTVDEDGDGLLKNRGRQSAPARLAAQPAFEVDGAVEEEEARGRKSSRGGSSRGRSRSKVSSGTSRGRKSTVDEGAPRKASVSRKRSSKKTA